MPNMDTDDLTEMAYQTIVRAYRVSDILSTEIGASAANYTVEDEFLRGTLAFLDEILEDPEAYLDSWNLIGDINPLSFAEGVRLLRHHVLNTLDTPKERRGKPAFD